MGFSVEITLEFQSGSLGNRLFFHAETRESLEHLRSFFSELRAGHEKIYRVRSGGFIRPIGGLELVIRLAEGGKASLVEADKFDKGEFVWHVSREDLLDYEDKLDGMLAFGRSSHQYLIDDENGISIVIAWGED